MKIESVTLIMVERDSFYFLDWESMIGQASPNFLGQEALRSAIEREIIFRHQNDSFSQRLVDRTSDQLQL